jgi:hypothetical protein
MYMFRMCGSSCQVTGLGKLEQCARGAEEVLDRCCGEIAGRGAVAASAQGAGEVELRIGDFGGVEDSAPLRIDHFEVGFHAMPNRGAKSFLSA